MKVELDFLDKDFKKGEFVLCERNYVRVIDVSAGPEEYRIMTRALDLDIKEELDLHSIFHGILRGAGYYCNITKGASDVVNRPRHVISQQNASSIAKLKIK